MVLVVIYLCILSSINWKAGKGTRNEKVDLFRGDDKPPARSTRSRTKAAQQEDEEQNSIESEEPEGLAGEEEDDLPPGMYIVQKVLAHRSVNKLTNKYRHKYGIPSLVFCVFFKKTT